MNTTPLPRTTTIAIVGAGPAGLTAAITLADAGIDFVLLDRLAQGANTSRAAVVHARTLEVLAELGLDTELIPRGIQVPIFRVHDGARTLAKIQFGGLPTAYPYTLMVPQDTTEEVLLERLHRAGGQVHRPYQVTRITDENDGVTIEYTDAVGVAGTIRADYVIGADGMHSVVRDQAGIGFTGAAYPESFVLADVRMTWPIARDEVALHLSPEGVTVVAPLPDADQPDRYRVVATLDDAPEHPTVADIQTILDTRGPGGDVKVTEVLWSSRFRVHHRVADRYRAGRILLAGDAAHVHSPAGGQGMNTGIQDAAFLGPLLARVVRGEPETLLDTYETTRRPVALEVVAFTDRMTRMATLRPRPARLLRNTVLSLATRIPAVRTRLAFRIAELQTR
ncbi:FAD-dependent oxidoreductase [Nocardia goodfellowii]|uniref:2-polyprenyl-6-methoxyphenol hydroxylase-like FAD-dependent oxidoreductase n=1 Tax=Nocardia goodfellowii TaxID=882446 RepID=A0ABS4Q7M9_9NOCA|nr:FAD-dependent monooxygenase [Nocardia goodfellowii]MBP2187695.1 2-polyprenyl-6-methoxyphenol hydroxylase-like FAD-dependent oxidoreductase [Nocardia goodfellowii]